MNKPMPAAAKCLAILGTGSDVGKSIAVTALCRIFCNCGIRTAPYKAQNMSNNSYVTVEGGEIGRAQAVQAEAARATMHVDMNPVLLKPCTDTGSQVVLLGKALKSMEASEYFSDRTPLFQASVQALNRLRSQYELIVIEGAGSCAEVNLRKRDFVNFETAHAADAPVILIADIDRGGVFAQVVGTLEIIPPKDRARVKGILINRFRGDLSLFEDGVTYLEERTGLPVLGVIPHYYHIDIDSEDGMPLDTLLDPAVTPDPRTIRIAVIRLPHISNFTDFNALIREPSVTLHYLSKPRDLSAYDALILPGTKNVCFDLEWMRKVGWESEVVRFHQSGRPVTGICGGYQLLGKRLHDPLGVEGPPGSSDALGFLDVETEFQSTKIVTRTMGRLIGTEMPVSGYEIHMGVSMLGPEATPFARITKKNDIVCDNETDGATDARGQVFGTYLHGIFDNAPFRRRFLQGLRSDVDLDAATDAHIRDAQYDLLAEHFAAHMNLDKIFEILGIERPRLQSETE